MKLSLPSSIRRKSIQLGWPGAIGAGCLAMCLAFYFSTVHPAQQRLDAARLSARSLDQRMTQASQTLSDSAPTLDEQLAAFYRVFPGEHDATDWVGKIAAIAQRDGLSLQQADYKMVRDKTGKLTRFQMSLPLKGEYQTIRRFLSDLRVELPLVSLEQVQFERQKVGDSQVDAKVGLVIFLGSSS